jgi:hypothetical protein
MRSCAVDLYDPSETPVKEDSFEIDNEVEKLEKIDEETPEEVKEVDSLLAEL